MQIIAVDNNLHDLSELKNAVLSVFPGSTITGFTDPLLAVKHCMNCTPDLVFSEQDLKYLDGFSLLKLLLQKYSSVHGILISGDDGWRRDAANLMLGFIQKPVTTAKITAWKLQTEEEEL